MLAPSVAVALRVHPVWLEGQLRYAVTDNLNAAVYGGKQQRLIAAVAASRERQTKRRGGEAARLFFFVEKLEKLHIVKL